MTIRLRDGEQYSSATKAGWPGSGVSIWGPAGTLEQTADPFDVVVIAYDAAGHVLREAPMIFLG